MATTVTVSATSLSFDALSEVHQLHATVRDQRGVSMPTAVVSWSSSDELKASVSVTGLVTALGNGDVTVTASSGQASATVAVTVAQTPVSLVFPNSSLLLTALGATATLPADVLDPGGSVIPGAPLVWTSSDEAVASVDDTGLVTATGVGSAEITAVLDSLGGSADVTVEQVPTSILLTPPAADLGGPGDTVRVAATVLDAGGSEIPELVPSWSSDEEAVATVDGDGLVTAVTTGSTTVTAEVATEDQPVAEALPVQVSDGVLTGPQGGQISVAGGAVTLDVPGGALTQPVFLTAEPFLDAPAGSAPVPGTAFDFGPDGMVFDVPVTLTIAYDPAEVPPEVDEEDLRLHKLVGGRYVAVSGSTVDVVEHEVSAAVQSFSVYGVLQMLAVTTPSLPDAAPGIAYSESLAAAGGDGPYSWALASGSGPLPPGLSLSPAGAVTGTPTGGGTYSFTVEVSDGIDSAQGTLSITVLAGLAVATTTLPNAAPTVPYAETLAATGGDGSYTWALVSGALPGGLSLAPDGAVTGVASVGGTSGFTVEVVSGDGQSAQAALSITVTDALAVFTSTLPDGVEDEDYGTAALVATGGEGGYSWSVVAGSLPAGLSLSSGGDITGTPTSVGSTAFTVEVASGVQTAQQALSITVHPALVVTTVGLPDGVEDVGYGPESLSASGGLGGYSWSVAAGSLPAGLSLSSGGAITGTPTVVGTSNFTVAVTSGEQTAQAVLSITVNPLLVVVTTVLPAGAEDTSYGPESLVAIGGAGGLSWAVVAGALPAGLSLSAGGSISGTPSSPGTANFTVEVTSGDGQTAQRALSITVHPLLAVTTASLPNGVQGVGYGTQSLSATGGIGGYAWSLAGGSLPNGLSLSGGGNITGTPTSAGTANFTVEVASGAQTAQQALSITVHATLAVTTSSLPNGVQGVSYGTQSLSAAGGDGSFSWSVGAGSLPPGLGLAANGDVTGTPTASGTSNFTVEVASAGQTAQQALSITVHPLLVVTTGSLPSAVEDAAYGPVSLAATGGAGGYAWSLASGSLPAGVGIAANGDVSGTPTASGTSNFTVEVSSGGQVAQQALSITVHATLAVSTTTLPDGVEGVAYGPEALAATGGDASYTWAVVSGSLPAGLSLGSSGSVTGTPTEVVTSNFTAEVSSGDGQTAQRALSIRVTGPPAQVTILTQPSGSAQSGVAFGQQPVVEVRDSGGNLLDGFDVTASVASGGGALGGVATVQTNGSGMATFSGLSLTGLVGAHTLDFTAGSASIESSTITLQAGPPASVVILTQPSAAAQSGVPLAQQPSVQVQDGGTNPVAGVDVEVSIDAGGGTLGGTTTIATNGSGQATFGGLAISGSPGPRTLRFQAGGASAVSSTVTLSAGPPAQVTIVTQPSSSAQSGVPFGQQPAVDVRDGDGNLVGGVDVDVSIASGGGSLGGTTTVATNGSGRATFAGLSISGSAGARTLDFQAGSASAVSDAIDLTSGQPALMTILTQPSSSAQSGVLFGQQPLVEVTDEGGNPTAGFLVTVTIESGAGALGGTTSATTNGSGVATFTDLMLTGLVGERTLSFTSGAASIESGTIVLGAGPPASLLIQSQPASTALSGVTLAQQPSVEVRDGAGNLVDGVGVTASIVSGGGSLGGTTTVSTNGSGVAAFTNLSISGSPGERTLRFMSGAPQISSTSVHVSYAQGTYLNITYCGSQQMDVYVPSNSFARPLPVAVWIHGGGWTAGDKSNGLLLTEVRDELLTRGYVVVSPNYRLATVSSNKWPAQINDVKCVIRHLRAEAADYGFDGVRIGAMGVSAGGHLSAMLGVTDAGSGFEGSGGYGSWSSSVLAAVVVGGISDITDSPDHPELQFSGGERAFTTWPGPSPELTDASPITWASSDDPPFLIVHGDQDDTVLYPQATKLRDALQAVPPVDVTLQTVTNGGHNLEDVGAGTPTPSLSAVTQQISDFFDTHVRFGS